MFSYLLIFKRFLSYRVPLSCSASVRSLCLPAASSHKASTSHTQNRIEMSFYSPEAFFGSDFYPFIWLGNRAIKVDEKKIKCSTKYLISTLFRSYWFHCILWILFRRTTDVQYAFVQSLILSPKSNCLRANKKMLSLFIFFIILILILSARKQANKNIFRFCFSLLHSQRNYRTFCDWDIEEYSTYIGSERAATIECNASVMH